MYYSLGLKPFKDLWINCSVNTLFSILISREPSYRLAPLLNNYTYQVFEKVTPNKTKVDCLMLLPLNKYKRTGLKFHFKQQPFNFKRNIHYVEYLQGLVREGNLVTVGVDLFYWIPNSICWNKHHWDHYSLINGFDDERKVFYVFDDNIQGFDEYEVPEERFRTAIQNLPLKPHGYLCQISNIEPFELSLQDVVANAKELARELGAMSVNNLFRLSEEDFAARDMCDLLAMYIFQIQVRQKANQLLFKLLQEQRLVPQPELMEGFIQNCLELQNGWAYVKGKFIRTYVISDKDQSILDINKKCNYLFDKEGAMWGRFRDCFG